MKKFFVPQVLKSLIIIFAALSIVTGSSYSAWTSQVKITGNSFETGTVEISVTPATAVFNFNNMAPGVWNEKDITVKNNGTLDYQYSIGAELSEGDENASKLFNKLWVEIYDENDAISEGEWLAQLEMPSRLLESGDSETLNIKIKLDDDVDNSYQDLAANFNLVFTATQSLSEQVESGVVINEIAWMGTVADSSDEWIELYNSGSSEVNLDGWKIQDKTTEFELSGTIPAQGYYLIEDNEEVTNITADLLKSALSLSNDGEQLILIDEDEEIVDTANGVDVWLAGKNDGEKPTMERKTSSSDGIVAESWADNDGDPKNGLDAAGNTILGTPKAKNSVSE